VVETFDGDKNEQLLRMATGEKKPEKLRFADEEKRKRFTI
jgi:hypothetical protein